MQLDLPREALSALDRSLAFESIGDDSASAWMNKASIYAELDDLREARAHLRRAVAARPSLRAHAEKDADLAPLLSTR
jgi:hypothetical protein